MSSVASTVKSSMCIFGEQKWSGHIPHAQVRSELQQTVSTGRALYIDCHGTISMEINIFKELQLKQGAPLASLLL